MTYKQGDCIYILKPALVLSAEEGRVLVTTGSGTPYWEKTDSVMTMNSAPATIIKSVGVLNGNEGYKGDSQSQHE